MLSLDSSSVKVVTHECLFRVVLWQSLWAISGRIGLILMLFGRKHRGTFILLKVLHLFSDITLNVFEGRRINKLGEGIQLFLIE